MEGLRFHAEMLQESEVLRTLAAGGATLCSGSDVPDNLRSSLPALAELCELQVWGDLRADVLPFTDPQHVVPPRYLQTHLTDMPIRKLASLALLADFLDLARVRNVCIYVLVKRRSRFHTA